VQDGEGFGRLHDEHPMPVGTILARGPAPRQRGGMPERHGISETT
jgi:hypothetical protein